MRFEVDESLIINSGDANEYAKARKKLSFRDFVIMALEGFSKNEKEFKQIRTYFAQGGGATWNDILKAVRDDNEQGKRYVEMFRQVTEAELMSRGVISPEAEKPIPKWE